VVDYTGLQRQSMGPLWTISLSSVFVILDTWFEDSQPYLLLYRPIRLISSLIVLESH
jgi:hypothetical protein